MAARMGEGGSRAATAQRPSAACAARSSREAMMASRAAAACGAKASQGGGAASGSNDTTLAMQEMAADAIEAGAGARDKAGDVVGLMAEGWEGAIGGLRRSNSEGPRLSHWNEHT